jgi:hypothetical protein
MSNGRWIWEGLLGILYFGLLVYFDIAYIMSTWYWRYGDYSPVYLFFVFNIAAILVWVFRHRLWRLLTEGGKDNQNSKGN